MPRCPAMLGISRFLAACVVLSVAIQVASYPDRWIAGYLDAGFPAGVTCISHPGKGWGQHGSPSSAAITFNLTDSSGRVVSTICPGATYTIAEKLAGSDSGHIFVTTTAGSLSPGEKPSGCNGARYASANRSPTSSQRLTVDCSEVSANDKVVVSATYATGTGGSFHQGSTTFKINSACYKTTCSGGGGGGSSPSPSPNTPSPSPKPCRPRGGDDRRRSEDDGGDDDNGGDRPKLPPCPNPCTSLPVVAGISWPASCAGKKSCQANCKTGFKGGRVKASCSSSKGWSISGRCTCASKGCSASPSPSPSPSPAPPPPASSSSWDHWGLTLENTRNAENETIISPANAARLGQAWAFTASNDVTATPTVVGNRLLVPDWGGYMYCINADTGALIWSRTIIDYVLAVDPNPNPSDYTNSSIISRTSPAVFRDIMVFGVMKKGGGFPYLIAANITNGALIWGNRTDPHPAAMMTQSPTIHGGFVYAGVSSLEELKADTPGYPCCTFIGNMLKVDLYTGVVVWRTYMAPPNNNQTGGFSGNSIWGSSPSLNLELRHVYIATGNNYNIPNSLANCIKAIGNLTLDNMDQQLKCEKDFGAGNYHNSMLALDMDTGSVRWVKQLGGPDAWNAACLYGNNNQSCPDINSPDYDFGQAPMLVNACKNGVCKKRVVAGQKSGWLWSLKPEDGSTDWALLVGPGGTVGGLQWGSAADSARVYVSNNNYNNVTVDLTQMNAVPNVPGSITPPSSTQGGLTAAVDACDGTLLWTFANPTMHWDTSVPARNARSQAPMTVSNGVVYYASMDAKGTLFFLEAATGRLLGSFETGATLGCGPSLARGRLYTGSGYLNFGLGQKGNKLYALEVK